MPKLSVCTLTQKWQDGVKIVVHYILLQEVCRYFILLQKKYLRRFCEIRVIWQITTKLFRQFAKYTKQKRKTSRLGWLVYSGISSIRTFANRYKSGIHSAWNLSKAIFVLYLTISSLLFSSTIFYVTLKYLNIQLPWTL